MKKMVLKMMPVFCSAAVMVNAQNAAPVVKAGVDQLIVLPGSAKLQGSATDDGFPGPLTTIWSMLSGPGVVSFSSASTLQPAVTFSAPGTYYLRLSANDGALTKYDDVRITVKANASERKCNPGNYVAFGGGGVSVTETINAVTLPGVAGMQERYDWKTLEPVKGQYDFSAIRADLNTVSTLGKQLVAMVQTKSFSLNSAAVPSYLSSYTAQWGPNANGGGGVSIALWQPEVITRFKLLLDTLAKAFDAHPNFEGVATQETALGSPWTPSLSSFGYTPEIYRDAMINILTGASNSFKQSGIFWYMNFMPSGPNTYLSDVALAVAPLGAAKMGGPDVLPDDYGLKTRTYPLYDVVVGKMPLFCSLQNDSYGHLHADTINYSTKYWTLQELADFSRNNLHVNYLFWNYKTWKKASQPDEYDFDDAKPVIANNPSYNPQLINPGAAGNISGSSTVCNGQTNVSYSVPAITGATGYSWSYSGTGVSITGTGNTISIDFSSGATSGNLTVAGCNCCGSGKVSAKYAIDVNSNVTASVSVSASPAGNICAGSNVIFTAAPVNGGAAPVYQWKLNGSNVGTNSTSYSNTGLANGNTVRCVVTSNATCVAWNSVYSNIVTMTVTPVPVTPVITQNANVLTSNAAAGNQWYRNGTLIAGATNSTYTVTSNGTYTVVVTVNGCSSGASLPLVVNSTGISEEGEKFITIYPDPASTYFTFRVFNAGEWKNATIKIYDALGKEIAKDTMDALEKNVDVSAIPDGIYLLKLETNNNTLVQRFIVQH